MQPPGSPNEATAEAPEARSGGPADRTDAHEDAALVARCRAGDESAWNALVQRYQRLVYAVARRGGLDEHAAGDVFQTVFARLLEHLPRLKQPERLQAWVVTTAKRETLAYRARADRHQSIDDDDAPALEMQDGGALPGEALDDLQQLAELRWALERLDRRCATLLELLFRDAEDELGYDEIARRAGMPRGSIGPTRARCLDKLRSLWRPGAR